MTVLKSPTRRFFDEQYAQKKNTLQLFLQLSKTQLFMAYFDATQIKYVGIEEYYLGNNSNWQQTVKELLPIFNNTQALTPKKVVAAIVDDYYTLVPFALFDEKETETYLRFNHQIPENNHLISNYETVEAAETVVAYSIAPELKEAIESVFINVSWHSSVTPLIERILLEKGKSEALHLYVHANRFDIVQQSEGKLLFFNSFKYSNIEDFAYYLLYCMEQLKLDRETAEIILYGEIEEKSSLFEILFKYIRNVSMYKKNGNINYAQVLNQLSDQYYFNLFSLYLCE